MRRQSSSDAGMQGLWGFAGFLLFCAAFAALFVIAQRPPHMPADGEHELDQEERHCLICHGFGKKHSRPWAHPLRDDCFSCHRDAEGQLHPRPNAPTALPEGWLQDPRLKSKACPNAN